MRKSANETSRGALQFGVKLVNRLAILHHRTIWSADGWPTAQTYAAFEELSDGLDFEPGRYSAWRDY